MCCDLHKPSQYRCGELSINALKRVAGAVSNTNAARHMQQAKAKLFEGLPLRVGVQTEVQNRGNDGPWKRLRYSI
jgi:hypothetical protein